GGELGFGSGAGGELGFGSGAGGGLGFGSVSPLGDGGAGVGEVCAGSGGLLASLMSARCFRSAPALSWVRLALRPSRAPVATREAPPLLVARAPSKPILPPVFPRALIFSARALELSSAAGVVSAALSSCSRDSALGEVSGLAGVGCGCGVASWVSPAVADSVVGADLGRRTVEAG